MLLRSRGVLMLLFGLWLCYFDCWGDVWLRGFRFSGWFVVFVFSWFTFVLCQLFVQVVVDCGLC